MQVTMRTISEHRLEVEDEVLGEGFFGEVRKGVWTSNRYTRTVAVKVAQSMSRYDLKEEAELMSSLSHPNIVKFYGYCPELSFGCLVMELMENGSLSEYIRQQGSYLRKNPEKMVQICLEVAKGLEYLERKGYVHRDVAARNCLVDANHVAKVADFGMARRGSRGYQLSYNSHIPLRWAAPEVLKYQTCTNKSDVWSFGVLMWEVYTFGSSIPYGPHISNVDVSFNVKAGSTLNQPRRCPHDVYEVMEMCFEYSPDERPDFEDLCQSLEDI